VSREGRSLPALSAVIALIAILLVAQMWLLTASLEAYLAGHRDAALPGAIVSGILFLSCGALYWFVLRRLTVR
jgi:hypothetical protein